MKKRIIIVVTALVAILLGTVNNSSITSAHSFAWWCKPREVKVVKSVRINKIKKEVPLYKSHCVGHKILKKGTRLKIQHVASYTWIVQKKGLANGYFNSSNYFWETGNFPKHWYKLVK
ncbi:hypothetical protein OZX69_03990 [Lactobacillus sp. ESL0731]|uniref:hypothetical protein n=1 Tax=unclassified Lactobacillus TaxID=2620435 RepID=UPI0023F626DF|nr:MULTISPECIES: hypothetical protein [unclassified Lactobacillus]WEV51869.1 hypothetical protein OZX63_03985 [Lactobacillus sp. ESL0700]WEV63000.1 hypothetical protein OZX69_03990 [Lactobacillus sp. ESL0731]